MSDLDELERLAHAAHAESFGTYTALREFEAAASPAAVLALVGRLREAESDRDRLTAQNNRLRVVLAEYADRGSWACSRNTEYRDLWLLYEHGYSRAWEVIEQEWPARAALGGEARDAE
jgi:hypothetical protein